MGILEQLASELGVSADELRSELLDTGGESEVLQANYLTVDSQGRVGANFSGHVSARGIDLPMPNGPSADNKIKWIRPDGTTGALASAADAGANRAQQSLQVIHGGTELDLIMTADEALPSSVSAFASRALIPAQKTVNILTMNVDGTALSDFELWGPWTALGLNATNWQNQPGGQPAQYRVAPRAGGNSIQLRGSVQSITAIAMGFAATGRISSLPAGFVPATNDQIRIAPGTDPGAGNVIWGTDVTNPGGTLYVFREHTGKAVTLAAGVVVDIATIYSTE